LAKTEPQWPGQQRGDLAVNRRLCDSFWGRRVLLFGGYLIEHMFDGRGSTCIDFDVGIDINNG
jgi:hypothetical protein